MVKIGSLSVPLFFSLLEKLPLQSLSFCSYLGWLCLKPAHTHTLELELLLTFILGVFVVSLFVSDIAVLAFFLGLFFFDLMEHILL